MLVAHVTRNALIPTLTLLGVNIAYLIGSTVVIEKVFGLNGLGTLLLDRDHRPRLSGRPGRDARARAGVVLVNLATDLVAARLDPRIRLAMSVPIDRVGRSSRLVRRPTFLRRAMASRSLVAGVIVGVIALAAIWLR